MRFCPWFLFVPYKTTQGGRYSQEFPDCLLRGLDDVPEVLGAVRDFEDADVGVFVVQQLLLQPAEHL